MAAGLLRVGGRGGTASRLPREPDFWRIWLIGLAMFIVRWIEMLAFAVFVYERTGSALLVAFMAMLRLAPLALFGAFLGDWADRLERRSALIAIVVLLLATSSALTLLMHVGELRIWHVAVASFVNGICWAADNPVRRMMLGEVVGPDRLGAAMGIEIGSVNASRIAGPTLGGLMMASVGIYGAFASGVAIYLVTLALALGIRLRNRAAPQRSGSMLARIGEGVRYARGNARLRGVLAITVIFNLFGWPATSMIPVIGQDLLHLGPAGIGVLASMDGVGALGGAIAVTIAARPGQYARLYVGGLLVYLVCISLFALASLPLLSGAILIAAGVGAAGFSAMQATLVYHASPSHMRARMLGLLSVCIGMGPIGFLHLGLLAEAIGAQGAVVATGIEGVLATILTRPIWRAIFAGPEPEADR